MHWPEIVGLLSCSRIRDLGIHAFLLSEIGLDPELVLEKDSVHGCHGGNEGGAGKDCSLHSFVFESNNYNFQLGAGFYIYSI